MFWGVRNHDKTLFSFISSDTIYLNFIHQSNLISTFTLSKLVVEQFPWYFGFALSSSTFYLIYLLSKNYIYIYIVRLINFQASWFILWCYYTLITTLCSLLHRPYSIHVHLIDNDRWKHLLDKVFKSFSWSIKLL